MRLVSWGLLLLYSAAITCVQDFQNHCADASKAMSALPQDLKIDRPFKVSAIVTDWKANSTMLIDEIRRNASFVIETTQKNSTSKLSTMDNQLLLSNNTGCSVVLDHTLFTLPSEITTIFPLEVTSLSGLVNDIVNRTIPGFKSYAKIVSGVEGVGWVGCVNSTNSSAVVAVEVVYAGEESFNPPSPTFKNPVILSLVFSHFANVSDANSTMAARISLDFTPFREPLDLTSQLEITHGTFCSGLNSSEMNVHFPPQFEVIYSKDSGSSVTNKLMYDSVRNMSAETVVDGRAHLLNESLPGEAYLVVHDVPRGMRFVFSPSPSCSVEAFHGWNDASSNEFLRPIDLFIPQLSTLNFTLHSNVSGLLEYRSSWGDKVIEARVQNTTLSTVAIYSKGTLESIIELTIKEVKPHFEDSVGLASLLRECFNRFSDNLVSFELIGVSSEMMSKRREDAVWDKMATTLASIPNASINPYRLSFFSVGDGEAETKNTRVVMRVADGKDSTAKEMTSSQFLILLNSTLPGGISINVSDTEIWKTGDLLVPYPPLPPVVPPAFSGYTGGSMLVLGLFMVMLGAVVGAGGVYLAFRRQRISTLAYQVFE